MVTMGYLVEQQVHGLKNLLCIWEYMCVNCKAFTSLACMRMCPFVLIAPIIPCVVRECRIQRFLLCLIGFCFFMSCVIQLSLFVGESWICYVGMWTVVCSTNLWEGWRIHCRKRLMKVSRGLSSMLLTRGEVLRSSFWGGNCCFALARNSS